MIEYGKLEPFVNSFLAVAIGGAVGAVLRFAVSEWIGSIYGTLIVNAIGSFLIGVCMAALASDLISKDVTILLCTGILGAFTTMSTFSFETIELWNEDKIKAISYAIFTVMICPILAFVGWRIVESTS